ncbi:transmembrane amino acid transporter family protein [Coniochaeta sp. 2T2.1]|nr:transmembrane amino acid transporter family protein [Coniochaeta sp. 2T2.1]
MSATTGFLTDSKGPNGLEPRHFPQDDSASHTGAVTAVSISPSSALHASAHYDPSVSFEEYLYYAQITRAEEAEENVRHRALRGPTTLKSIIKDRFSKGHHVTAATAIVGEKTDSTNIVTGVTEAEWKQASRAVRTAGWGGVFYLIVTDILGPFSTPWSFAQMGYGPGVALFTVFGVMAYYSGYTLYLAFLDLDSDRYPLRSYGDFFYRLFGPLPRRLVDSALGIQMMLLVSTLILSNGQAISQISQGQNGGTGLCFAACLIIFMAAGFILGQIRTLQRFGWIANLAVWINLLIIFICMGVAANSPPNFKAAMASFSFEPGPIKVYAGTPRAGMATGGSGFIGSLNGLNQAVYSYGGAMIFTHLLAEMRHPMDFWKALLIAEIFIYVVYMFFGIFVYSYQGQFTFNPVMQGLSPYGWQTACNIMNLFTGLIAAALYGNIGLKVLYVDVLQEVCGLPPLTVQKGKLLWLVLVPIYWAVAFVVAAAIPQFSFISGLIGALFILSFTYTLPAIIALGYGLHKDAMVHAEERFDPATRTYDYVDRGFKRWARAYGRRQLYYTCNVVYLLGAMVTTGLGVYSSVEGLIAAFSGKSASTSFGCGSPV